MLYRAKINGDVGVKACKIIGDNIPLGYELTDTFFVDNSGWGADGELALTFEQFLKKVKAGYFYAIKEAGQFQVYISEFKKIAKSRAEIYKEQGIASSKLISKSCRVTEYLNGDKTIKLYATDILQFKGNKIILSSGGYKTVTTKTRINEFLEDKGFKVYQKKGEWFIDNGATEHIKFFDGIVLEADEKTFNNPAFCKECGIEFDLEIDNPLCLCDNCLNKEVLK